MLSSGIGCLSRETRLVAVCVCWCASWLSPVLVGAAMGADEARAGQPDRISFARDVRPILAAACFHCHGPDEGERKAGLRLDTPEGALGAREDGAAFVPGSLEKSLAWQRITAADESLRMPPPDSGKVLRPEQIEVLKVWIEQGAEYAPHWAFVPPERPPLPKVSREEWVRNPIDRFILARLEAEGLAPAAEADRATLLRRLSLDLVGLPPEPVEIDAFLADTSPAAYEKQVERLLESPHYGERWGRVWLDAARYADSDGYEKDKPRQVWCYRDWVIESLNRDLPYDEFIIQQIAGDLLPNPTQDQLVATGFLRNSMINEEGGIDPEQFRMEAMFDRMDAIGKGILGLTIQCGQCHSHKYDPLTQEEYYRMFAFLNNAHEACIATYTKDEQRKRTELLRQIAEREAQLQASAPDWPQRMAAWEATVAHDQPEWTIVRPELDASGGQKHYLLPDGSVLAAGYAPTKHETVFTCRTDATTITAVSLELLNDPNLPLGGPGRSIFGLCALTEFKVQVAPADKPEMVQNVKIASATADVNPPETELASIFDDRSGRRRVTGPVSFAIDGVDETAWGLDIGPGRSNVPRKAVFVFEQPVTMQGGVVITFRLTQNHGGWNSDDNQNNNLGRFRFSVTDAPNPSADPLPAEVRQILAVPAAQRTPAQVQRLFSFWRTTVPEWQAANEEIEALWRQHPQGSSQLVLMERDEPRTTHLLVRGDFLKPGPAVSPGVPAFLHPLPADQPLNRLTFARWLVDRRSPTTARSLVNRVWQAYFGQGLVSTSEDLGVQCEPPSHPELLDWLAVEFMEAGWSLKHLHRLIVTSATYRQDSRVTPELLVRDPYNRLLARGPRFRVEGELVRDIALAASGLLVRKVGGPSVFAPAPEFLFVPPASYGPKVWREATGEDRYRRGLYTFCYRSVPYPVLQAFDVPNGDFSCVRRVRSNTPLQALTLLNETLFVECARALALRTLAEGGRDNAARLTYAFRRCLGRLPTQQEAEILLGLLWRQTARYASGELNPWELAAQNPDQPPELPAGVSPAEAAAWTAVSRVLLNLDETVTKN